jgi:hypothetical protein
MKTKLHWNIFEKKWTVRTYKSCARHDVVLVKDWKTEVKPEYKNNPKGWIHSDHTNFTVNPSEEVLNNLVKKEKLIYDKHKMFFNIAEGDMVLCDKTGCFIVESNTKINSPR